jgi:hypothetical protein
LATIAGKIVELKRENPSADLRHGTILGGFVDAPDRAFLWCDSEVFSEDRSSGHAPKLAINSVGACCIVGSGRMGPFRDAADALLTCIDFDEAVAELPRAMRMATKVYRATEIAARAPLRSQFIGLIGFSRRYGRVVAAKFELDDDFAPAVPCRSFMSPTLDGVLHIKDHQSLIAIARRQLEVLRQRLPDAGGGALIIAEVGRDGVVCGPRFEFATGKVLRTGWRPPDQVHA